MSHRPPPEPGRDDYRTGYLKLRSVLYDRNTGLPALPVLLDELRTLVDERREVGVLHVEIAALEMVESLYGWQVFDRIVARVAALLGSAVGGELPAETRLAVNGVAGDRFVAFVPARAGRERVAGLGRLSERLRRALESAFDADEFRGLSPRICFRVGQATLSDDPFYRFERCVYAAVERARKAPVDRERLRERSWGEELERIIRSEALEVLFQPVVEIDSGTVLGAEALVRGPADSIFEAPRAMFALSARVGVATQLDRACCTAALDAFARAGATGKLFLNVLPESVEDDGWRHGRFRAALASCALSPEQLVLEVSERAAAPDPQTRLAGLGRLKQEGFGLALDDVGTGRIALAALERSGLDFLKLDVSFVRNIHESLIQQELLLTLARLAERIGGAVIAEGVESEDEARALAERGARYAQGYLFAAPAARGLSCAARRGREA
jgi:EAL domain-containing protein (putative c-di-GMP-specific phosphodiesterase class I)/GGDEF domain-containing protein